MIVGLCAVLDVVTKLPRDGIGRFVRRTTWPPQSHWEVTEVRLSVKPSLVSALLHSSASTSAYANWPAHNAAYMLHKMQPMLVMSAQKHHRAHHGVSGS